MAQSYGTDEQGGGLRVNPAYLEQGQVATSSTTSGQRRATHSISNNSAQRPHHYYRERDRRHTLASHTPATAAAPYSQRPTTNEQKRELFLEYLKQKYPEHSGTIEMAKKPDQESLTFSNGFYDDDGTMSEMDTQATGFQRGVRVRTSLPGSRPLVNKSKEKPLGLVYLIYMSETKRALMPNEVTGMDTVKALFVRAFPRKLTMEMLDNPQRKIYIRDNSSEIFYELEKLDEVKDRVVLKIYEPGFVEETPVNIRNSTSTPLDLNICSDSELADIELPDFRERSYKTMGSRPTGTGQDRFDPLMKRPNSTTPMEMGSRRMHPQQGRPNTSTPLRSPPNNEPFQRGAPERSTAPVRPSSQAPFPRGSPQRLSSSTTLPRQQHHQQDGRRTPTNGRSLTMPRPGERGPVHRPHPEHGRQTTAMMPGPGPDPSRHPPVDRHRDPHHPQQGGGARTLERGMGPPRGTPQWTPDPRDGPRGGAPPPQHARDPPYRDSPRGHPPPSQQQGGGGSPVKAPRGEMRTEGPPYPRQPLPHEMQGRPLSRNSNQGMRQPPPNHMHPGPNRPHDRTMDRAHDRTMDRPRDRSMERPRSTPPHRVEHRGLGPPPMKHPHPPQANIREVEARMVRQGQISSTSPPGAETSERITAMEQQIASLAGMVRSVLKPGEQPPPGQQTPPPPSQQQQQVAQQQQVSSPQRQVQQRAITDRLVSPVQTPNRSGSELTGLNEEVIRATQNQKTFTAVDSYRDGTDSQSVTPQPMSAINTSELRETTLNLKHTVRDLRDQLKQIRKLQLNMVQDMNVAFRATNRKVQLALEATPAGNEHPIRALRTRTHQDYLKYQISRDRLDKQIRDLESAVEEMRDDVVNRHCHVNLAEVDALAQAIGNSSKHIAEQKVAFPVLADKMKAVMQGEMEIVVSEENFIKDEPGKLDDYMKRCKKVTNTLCTLKRLASVQEHRTPVVPVFEQTSQPVNREALMETIQSISPNHEQRVKNLQAANESRERKRRFHTAQELHRFQMDIGRGRQTLRKTPNLERVDQQRRAALRKLYQSEEHDSLTPILTPEKMAKQEGSKGGKKKQPPPPPPKRTYLSQQAVASRSPATSPSSPGVPEPGPNPTPKPKLVVTSSEDSEAVPVVPPKPAMMMPKSKLPQQVDDPSSARSAPDLSCMNSTSSVNSECLSSPVRDLQPTCALSPSGCKSEPFLATSENAQSSMTNPRKVVLAAQRVGKPAADKSHQCVSGPVPGTVMTTQSAPMRSPRGQATPRSGQTSPRGATSPRGVVTPEGGIMLSQGAVMIAKSGSATSPGLATTPQRQAPVRLLSSSSQASPTKTNSPTSPQYKQSCIPVLKHSQHSRVQPPTTKVSETAVSNTHTQQTSPPSNPLPQRRSSVPSAMDVAPPPKPPRGCIDDPKEPTDAPPQSAFRPLAIPGWRETSLDEVPLKKSKVRRHTVTLPQHQKRNGWVAPVTDPPLNSSPQKPQPSQQTLLPVQQKSPVGRSVITNEPKAAPVKQGVLSKSQSGTDAELNPDRKPSLQRQNSDPGARPQVTIVDKKGALKIQQLKEQYAKLRKLQEEQKLLEQQSTRSSPSQPEATQQEQPPREATSTDLLDKIPPSTTLQVDVSYSQGESSKTEDQDEGSSYTKQTVVYRVGPKPFKSDEGKQSSVPLEELEKTTTVVSTKREVIADSIPVTNGMVHQPVFSQFKVHEMAPRNFATKAKPGVAQSPAAMVNGNGMEEKPSPKPNGGHAPTDTIKSSPVKGDVVTNGGGKLPLTNGGSEVAEGQGERVIERTEKEIKKFNAVNVNQNGKPELKTVYTKRLEETFIF